MIEYRTSVDFCLDALGGKWKVLILNQLHEGACRLSEIIDAIPGLTKRVLIRELRELEEDQVVRREEFDELVPRVEYRLTDHGSALWPIIEAMNDWGVDHIQLVNSQEAQLLKVDSIEDFAEKLESGFTGSKDIEEIGALAGNSPEQLKKKMVKRSKRLPIDAEDLSNSKD